MARIEETVLAIFELRGTLTRFRANLQGNEVQTRATLIDPMLRALGWDVGNPDEVALETGRGFGVADYALKDRRTGTPMILVEAKSLNTDLANAMNQVSRYCYSEGVRLGIVTDGDDWILLGIENDIFAEQMDSDYDADDYDEGDYDEVAQIEVIEIARFSISIGDAVVSAIRAQRFANPDFSPADWTSDIQAALALVSEAFANSLIDRQPEQSNRNLKTLGSLRELSNPPVPSALYFSDGYVFRMQMLSWSELVRNVAIYVGFIYHLLDEVELPIWAYRSRTKYVANDRPRHDNRREFELEYEMGDGIYIELHHTPKSGVNAACVLLEECGVDPNDVFISYDDNP